jgi:hypothetical protein
MHITIHLSSHLSPSAFSLAFFSTAFWPKALWHKAFHDVDAKHTNSQSQTVFEN